MTLTPQALARRTTLFDYLAGWTLATVPAVFDQLLRDHRHVVDAAVLQQVERLQRQGPSALAAQTVRSVRHHLRQLPASGFETATDAELDAVAARLCFQRWRYLTQRLADDPAPPAPSPLQRRVRTLLVWLRWGQATHALRGR